MVVVWLLVIPLIGSLVTLAVPARASKGVAAVVSLVTLGVFVAILAGAPSGVDWSWIPAWGVHFHVAADGLSLFLLGLTAVLFPLAIFASDPLASRSYYFWLVFLEFASLGLFMALDLFLFYIFWEVLLIPVFFLLSGWSGPDGRPAALKWLIMNLVGSLFMLVAIIAVAVIHNHQGGGLTFDISQLAGTHFGPGSAPWLFFAFLLAFAIKSPLWPFHGWMPDAYGKSAPPVTALISGVLSKAGIYGILRVMLPLFLPQFHAYQLGLLIFAAAGLVFGALMALRQQDMKMVTAYGSLSHMGMMALGIFSLTSVGVLGATFYMVAHGLMIGGLFLVLGMIENRTGTRDIRELGGLNHTAPRLAAYFLFFALGALGLPGLPGFAGEYMIIQGLVAHQLVFALIAGVVLTLAAWYMIRVFQGVMQGPVRQKTLRDIVATQVVWLVPLAGLVALLGVWPAAITTHAVPSLYHAVHLAKGGSF
ncbi:NADH dehydrogenase I chain M [Sulfobacillus acidophilus TPY]|uniref:NADH dehydrogenase subunit M n=1 Tax=Sulfobacillus acidophilus (strain ATCC 700253 / DSM 10332 / NAL) TaxID=679936 RepID=G8TYH6_SULAD|nr:NADH dehydrogenase I chain M [Sulfobacillus acidophilus TPY]AEW06237.1 NADH dehydrogenase subunit M [Sulfobacillus acidophilus DSM 10332]